MATDHLTGSQVKNWERGKDALERIMKVVPVEKIERLADRLEDPKFRASLAYKTFINSL